ncbi:MAG: 4Fe-4S binding protein [Synergistaceae bacterium]|jgi:2-oxoglutarate ferredoxin oxidoreductase subunit delta|nr:4Fe-4S binding protein [Synergistaceae bacterium]
MAELTIDRERCKGCGLCVRACPKHILAISRSFINRQGFHPAEITDSDACVACLSCALTCPDICFVIKK